MARRAWRIGRMATLRPRLAPSLHQPGLRQFPQGAVDSGAGAAEFLRQFRLRRDQRTGRPFALTDAAKHLVMHLPPGAEGFIPAHR